MQDGDSLKAQHEAGRLAFQRGDCVLACPHYTSENMPAATGEPVEWWAAKEKAWTEGFELERALNTLDDSR